MFLPEAIKTRDNVQGTSGEIFRGHGRLGKEKEEVTGMPYTFLHSLVLFYV